MKGSASPRWSNNEDWNTLMMASQNALIAYVFHKCTLNIFISWQAQWTNIVTMNTAETTHIAVWFCIVMWIVFTMIVITQLEIVNDCLSIKGKWLSIISFFNYVTEKGSWSSHPMLIIMVKKSMRVSGKMERWLVMVKWGKTFEFT